MKKRIFCTALVIVMLLFAVVSASAKSHTSLYINDSAWEEDAILPFIESEGRELVPALAFNELGGIKVSSSETLGSLLLTCGDEYLSYNLNFGTCIDESGIVTECEIFRYGGQIYLEPYAVCEKFDLEFETAYAQNGYLTARLTDSTEQVEFSTLLSSYSEESEKGLPYFYNPTGKTVAGSFVHPILLVPSPANVSEAIALLGKNHVTFAISPKEIVQYASVIPAIYANGHTLAYYMDSALDTDVSLFKQRMDSANEYLFSLVGKTSRIYVSSDDYDNIVHIDGYFAKACNLHLLVDDLRNDRMITTALYTSPNSGSFNFSLASDRATRNNYSYFFSRLELFVTLRSMPLRESSSTK